MFAYSLLRHSSKILGSSSLKPSSTLLGNNVIITKLVSQKNFASVSLIKPYIRNNKISQAVLKNHQFLRNSSTNADHRKLWTAERALSLILIGVIPYGIISPSIVTDNLMAVLTVAHIHWGVEAIVIDYVRPLIFGPVIPKVSLTAVYVLSAITLGGLLYYNFTNIGIGKTIRKAWNPKKDN